MSRPFSRPGSRPGSRSVPRFGPLLALLLAGGAATPAGARTEAGSDPFPRSALAPSPYTRGVKSSASTAPAPCVGPCGAPAGYGREPPAVGYAPLTPAGYAAPVAPPFAGGRTVHVGTGAAASQMLDLPRGKSAVIDLPADARDVLVTDPKVADVVLSTPRRIYVTGVASGQTDATFVDGAGRRILHLEIRVDQDWTAASDTLDKMMPGTRLKVHAANNNLIVTGEAASAGEAERALKLVGSFVNDPKQVVNLITLTGSDQVMLQVKIVEVNRSIIKQLGFDLGAITGQLGMPQYSLLKPPTYGVNGSFLGTFKSGYSVNTTSQPVSAFPLGNLFQGLSQAAGLLTGASAAGIPLAQIGAYVASFLSGTGQALTTAQSGFLNTYVAGVLGSTSTQITPNTYSVVNGAQVADPAYTATANLVGINSGNIAQFEQAFLNGGTVNGATLTNPQRLFLDAFNKNLSTYNSQAQYSLNSANDSLFVDRSNPANPVVSNRAGSTGLNQATSMVQAFERVGLIRTLAEPTLTAVSGEAGRFLVGGEFPVPVSQDVTGRISVEFKPYGVGLGYTPVVLSDGRISLKVSTEVSELTSVGGFTLNNAGSGANGGQTLVVPGLNVRRAETSVELPSGGAIVIAGLLSSQSRQTLDNVPGLGQVPILGTLLRSRDYQNNETELVIIVTPYLVKATRPDLLATPADGLQMANDIQTNLLGKLNAGFGKKPQAAAGKTYQGPFGYVVD